jgi:hypothetical protein
MMTVVYPAASSHHHGSTDTVLQLQLSGIIVDGTIVEYPESFVDLALFNVEYLELSIEISLFIAAPVTYPPVGISKAGGAGGKISQSNESSSDKPSFSSISCHKVDRLFSSATTLGGLDPLVTRSSRIFALRNESILNCRNLGIDLALGAGE